MILPTHSISERHRIVTERDGKCIVCGGWWWNHMHLVPHHIIPVRFEAGRWETNNMVSACGFGGCHSWLDARGEEQEMKCVSHLISLGVFANVDEWYAFKRKIKGYEV